MKKKFAVSALLLSLMTFYLTQEARSEELSVHGVIRPIACIPSLPNGGTVNYGTIPASSLTADAYTPLGGKTIPFTITCSAATKIALKASDNRTGTSIPGIVDLVPDSGLYGLGMVAGKKVGSYLLYFPQSGVTTDQVGANQIVSTDGNKTWTPTGGGAGSGRLGNDRTFSWAAPRGTIPMAFKTIRGDIHVYTYINKPENLPLAQNVPLDGSATLEIIYL